jgi:hypothetical protein
MAVSCRNRTCAWLEASRNEGGPKKAGRPSAVGAERWGGVTLRTWRGGASTRVVDITLGRRRFHSWSPGRESAEARKRELVGVEEGAVAGREPGRPRESEGRALGPNLGLGHWAV